MLCVDVSKRITMSEIEVRRWAPPCQGGCGAGCKVVGVVVAQAAKL